MTLDLVTNIRLAFAGFSPINPAIFLRSTHRQ
jgi:hypothetical protein